MAMTWVRVVRSDGAGQDDDFFMDRNYVDVAGRIGRPIRTETGDHVFETLDDALQALWRKRQVVEKPSGNGRANPVVVTLEPVAVEDDP